MAYGVIMLYHLHMPSYILRTFTEYPSFIFTRLFYSPNKSGRSRRVRSMDCCNSHSLIFAS